MRFGAHGRFLLSMPDMLSTCLRSDADGSRTGNARRTVSSFRQQKHCTLRPYCIMHTWMPCRPRNPVLVNPNTDPAETPAVHSLCRTLTSTRRGLPSHAFAGDADLVAASAHGLFALGPLAPRDDGVGALVFRLRERDGSVTGAQSSCGPPSLPLQRRSRRSVRRERSRS